MTANSSSFDRSYFERQYRDYRRQNPARKLDFYTGLAAAARCGAVRPRVLDVGCAFGLFLERLGPEWERVGVDASEYAIERARAGVPDARFEICEPGGFPVPGPFDLITAFDVLEHIPALEDTLVWIAANLRAGGEFIFVVPVYDGPAGGLVRLIDRDPTHVHKRERRFWLSTASRHLELVDWWGIFRYLVAGRFYVHAPARMYRRIGPAIACRMRRPA